MSQAPGKRAGKLLMIVAWAAALFLATRFFSASGKTASVIPTARCNPSMVKALSKCAC